MKINKSSGVTKTEKLLSNLCDGTFLRLWSYANPFQENRKELCDLLAVFENHVFIFFDRENLKFQNDVEVSLAWGRWKRDVIDKQIKTALGAERYIKSQKKIYLDSKCTVPFPIPLQYSDLQVHKIIVAHGAREACRNFSKDNISGSLAINYSGLNPNDLNLPFLVYLNKDEKMHILDSENLEIILKELDTFYDFKTFLVAKELAIKKFDILNYCGEEDLLANYFTNFNEADNAHYIGTEKNDVNAVMISEGEWERFIRSSVYSRKKAADQSSYLWDDIIQKTANNALKGVLLGNADVFNNKNALIEMAKEPRFFRRVLSEHMIKSIKGFPEDNRELVRNICCMPSFYQETCYVFLQLKDTKMNVVDYEKEYRPKRQALLQVACGVTKNKFPHYKKIIGIGIDCPKFSPYGSEDFILLDGSGWPEEQKKFYADLNKGLKFYETTSLKQEIKKAVEFPPSNPPKKIKVGRNEKCPCGSGKKYKKCHGI